MINGVSSIQIPVCDGVLQGWILGPTLFVLDVGVMHRQITSLWSRIMMFADRMEPNVSLGLASRSDRSGKRVVTLLFF